MALSWKDLYYGIDMSLKCENEILYIDEREFVISINKYTDTFNTQISEVLVSCPYCEIFRFYMCFDLKKGVKLNKVHISRINHLISEHLTSQHGGY